MTSGEFLSLSVELTIGMVVISVALAFFRLFRGPSLPDRVVALDMMTVAIVAFCGGAAVLYEQVAFLDVGLVLALVGFLATAALARYAERRRLRSKEEEEERE